MTSLRSERLEPNSLLDECPACGSRALSPVVDVDEVNLLCDVCGRCWHVESSRVWRVDPFTCAACPRREGCLTVLAKDRTAGATPSDALTL
jgi:hypothetical protein